MAQRAAAVLGLAAVALFGPSKSSNNFFADGAPTPRGVLSLDEATLPAPARAHPDTFSDRPMSPRARRFAAAPRGARAFLSRVTI